MLESNPPRNRQLETHRWDEPGSWVQPAPSYRPSSQFLEQNQPEPGENHKHGGEHELETVMRRSDRRCIKRRYESESGGRAVVDRGCGI